MADDLEYELYVIRVSNLLFAACIALICWEYLLHLPAEIRIHREKNYSLAAILLLIVRYSALASLGGGLAFVFANPPSCAGAAYTIEVAFWMMQSSVVGIFYLRTCAICHQDRFIRYILAFAAIACSACWFGALFALEISDDVPNLRFGGKCFQGQGYKPYHVMGYVASCGFDFLVVLITLYKVWSLTDHHIPTLGDNQHRISAYVFWQTLAYFFPVFCANFSAVLMSLIPRDFATRSIPVSYTFAVSSIAAARLVFHMRDCLSGGHVAELSHGSSAGIPRTKVRDEIPLARVATHKAWNSEISISPPWQGDPHAP